MRPHVLELAAFGAFPGEVRVDFDELAGSGLLLLSGPTGAGKTTLLDALGFALFGTVAGERSQLVRELRSEHAPNGQPTWVRLEFSVRERRLRVSRRPEQTRPSRRGHGRTTERATAFLEELRHGSFEPVAQRLDDVGAAIRDLLGMTADQFFQVVLLPQGRFDAFLRARHEEREQLLRQLFGIRRFEDAVSWLAESAHSAGQTAAAARQDLAVVTGKLAQAAGGDGTDPKPEPSDPSADPGWAGRLAAAAAEEAIAAAERAGAAAAVRAEREQELHAAVEAGRRQLARAELERRLAELTARDPDIARLRSDLDAARRAGPIGLVQGTLATRAAELAAARDASATASRAIAELPDPPALSDPPDADGLGHLADAAREQLGGMQALLDTLTEARAAAGDADRFAGEASHWAAEAGRLRGRLAGELPAAIAAADRARAAAAAAREGLAAAWHAVETSDSRVELAGQLSACLADAGAAGTRAAAATVDAERAAAHARDVRRRRIEAMSAELASGLVDGVPCLVCGSPVHPDPALFRLERVAREEEEEADTAAAAAAAEAAAATGAALALAERARGLARELGAHAGRAGTPDARPAKRPARKRPVERVRRGGSPEPLPAQPDVEDLRKAAEAARTTHTELAGAATALPAAEAELEQLHRELTSAAADLAAAEARSAELRKQHASEAARAARLTTQVATAMGGTTEPAALEIRVGSARERLAVLQSAAEAADGLRRAAAEHTAAEHAAGAEAARAGFADLEAARAALRPAEWLEMTAADVAAFDRAVAELHGQLANPDLAGTPGPVDQLETAAREAAQAHEDAVTAGALAEQRAGQLTALAPDYERAASELGPLVDQHLLLRGLAEVAAGRGGNRLGMPLCTFVLAARLEEVAAAATIRLARMTGGRFSLVHSDASRDRRQRAGLALQVEDSWTSTRRDTASLSGGETFLASLALALGLADVVTAEAGGARIDALFIDEGFGSLDPQTLDEVMDVLDDLRSGGRLVGVVSHVADLRERIPTRITVVKGPHGSRVEAAA